MKIKNGFTLAEILITLAIIGVISALVLPSLINSTPNREQIMLKKAYYLASRNINELINDEELYPERESETISGFSNVNINDQTADGREAMFHGERYSGDSKFCNLFAARMNIRGNINCGETVSLDNGGNFQSADGIVWSMPIGNFNRGSEVNQSFQNIQIDVNGTAGRNCFEGAGCTIPDRFTIQVNRLGRITVPANGIEQEYLTRSATNMSYRDIVNGARR